MGGTFHERKQFRKEFYFRYVYGYRLVPCSACAGSGHYDNTGSPRCGSCGGIGKTRRRSPEMTERARTAGLEMSTYLQCAPHWPPIHRHIAPLYECITNFRLCREFWVVMRSILHVPGFGPTASRYTV